MGITEQIGYAPLAVKAVLQLRPGARQPDACLPFFGLMQAPDDARINYGDILFLSACATAGWEGGLCEQRVSELRGAFWRTTAGRWQCGSVRADGGLRMVI
jgi:hypothetical protein